MGPPIDIRGIFFALVLAALISLPGCNCQMPFLQNKTQVTICTSPNTPMVTCGDESGDPATFTGYEIEVFKKLYPLLGWNDSNVKFKCMDWTDTVNLLLDYKNNNTCEFVVSGVAVAAVSMHYGVQYAWPTYKNGLLVAVPTQQEPTSIWASFRAFSAGVWIATVGTSIFIGILVWLIDYWSRDDNTEEMVKYAAAAAAAANKDSEYSIPPDALQDYIITAVGRPMQMRDAHAKSLASNIVLIFFSFACLVLVALYTASTAANITTTQLQSNIRNLNDLAGKVVGTGPKYIHQLQKYGISALAFTWENEEEEQQMYTALLNGTVQALVLESALLQYRAANNCAISIIGEPFEVFDQAYAFSPGYDNYILLKALKIGLIKLQENGTLRELEAKYISMSESNATKCKSRDTSGSIQQITFTQVAGLWIIIACGVAVGLVILLIHKLHVRYTRKKLREMKKFLSNTRIFSSRNNSGRHNADANDAAQNRI